MRLHKLLSLSFFVLQNNMHSDDIPFSLPVFITSLRSVKVKSLLSPVLLWHSAPQRCSITGCPINQTTFKTGPFKTGPHSCLTLHPHLFKTTGIRCIYWIKLNIQEQVQTWSTYPSLQHNQGMDIPSALNTSFSHPMERTLITS